eukprot:3802998-Amphidinium_carterae.1
MLLTCSCVFDSFDNSTVWASLPVLLFPSTASQIRCHLEVLKMFQPERASISVLSRGGEEAWEHHHGLMQAQWEEERSLRGTTMAGFCIVLDGSQ